MWLEALTQNAWDTGAGWGLIVAYAIYLRRTEDTTLNAFMLGFGNNRSRCWPGSWCCAPCSRSCRTRRARSWVRATQGLTLIWVPELFARMPAGRFFMSLFFMALLFAALTSLIAMIELAVRVLMDGGNAAGGARSRSCRRSLSRWAFRLRR